VPGAQQHEWTIGQVADKFALSVHTLRFYESEGLLRDIARTLGGCRVYTDDDLEWLTMCLNLRATGMPIPVIRHYVDLAVAGDQGPALADLLRDHRHTVQEQAERLHHCLELINHKIEVYGSPAPGSCEAASPAVTQCSTATPPP